MNMQSYIARYLCTICIWPEMEEMVNESFARGASASSALTFIIIEEKINKEGRRTKNQPKKKEKN